MLRAGDLVFTAARGGGILGRQILWWTRAWFEPPSRASHVAVVVRSAVDDRDAVIAEQTWPRIRRTRLGRYLDGGDVAVFRDRRLTDAQRGAIAHAALAARGAYGVLKIVRFLANAVVGKLLSLPIVLTGLLLGRRWRGIEPPVFDWIDFTGTMVCSQFIASLWWRHGLHFGKAWQSVTPDDMMDFCEAHPHRFMPVPLSRGRTK